MPKSKSVHLPMKKDSGLKETSHRRSLKEKEPLHEEPINSGRINRLRVTAIEHGRISGTIAMQAEAETSKIRGISTASIRCIMIKWWGSTTASLTHKIHLHYRTLTRTTIGNHSNPMETSIIPKFFLLSKHNSCNKVLNLSKLHPSSQFFHSKVCLDSIRPLRTLKIRKAFSEVLLVSTIIESSETLIRLWWWFEWFYFVHVG